MSEDQKQGTAHTSHSNTAGKQENKREQASSESPPTNPSLNEQSRKRFRNASRPPENDTAVLANQNKRLRRKLEVSNPQGTATLGERREIIFVIRGMVERFTLADDVSIILGRSEPGARAEDGIVNLTPYGALDRGVSRHHARLHLKDDHLYVTDLGSTNGTFLAGKKLRANEPTLIRKGDELLLGRLTVQVLFR